MKVALLHYAYTPVIGGVEFVIEQQAALFSRRGFEVVVVCGAGKSERRDVEVVVVPELLPGSDACVRVQKVLRRPGGGSFSQFVALREHLRGELRAAVEGCSIVFVHNVMTMHFNLAATAALWDLGAELGAVRFVDWVHDLSAVNPDYEFPDPEAYPWDLMARPAPGFEHVAISTKRQNQFCELMGLPPESCPVVPNGVEYLRLMRLTENVHRLSRRFGILYRDIVFVHPTRILKRKNIECGVRVLAELKGLGARCLYLVTGAPDPHNAEARAYGAELNRLIVELGVELEFVFVSEHFPVTDNDLISLYQVSDALFFPSRQEGFGLPLLEAGLFRIPAFCSDLEPMRSILKHNISFFDPDADPWEIAIQVIHALGRSKGFLARKEVMRKYSWDRVYDQVIAPLFFHGAENADGAGDT